MTKYWYVDVSFVNRTNDVSSVPHPYDLYVYSSGDVSSNHHTHGVLYVYRTEDVSSVYHIDDVRSIYNSEDVSSVYSIDDVSLIVFFASKN